MISLGTGEIGSRKYDAKSAANWGGLGWIISEEGSAPVLDAYSQGSQDMVDYHIHAFFKVDGCQDNYLRITVSLDGSLSISYIPSVGRYALLIIF